MPNLEHVPGPIRNLPHKKARNFIITTNRFRLIAFLVTMAVAALAIVIDQQSAVVWAFLSLIVGQLLGQKQSE
jgi:hypothetical protein